MIRKISCHILKKLVKKKKIRYIAFGRVQILLINITRLKKSRFFIVYYTNNWFVITRLFFENNDMTDLFEDEEALIVDEQFEDVALEPVQEKTTVSKLDARRRLESMLEERRLRAELDDFMDY